MARNIKQVSHDLTPIIHTISDLGQDVNTLLHKLYEDIKLTAEHREHFQTLIAAMETLNASSKLAKQYIHEVDTEADQAGIVKSYSAT